MNHKPTTLLTSLALAGLVSLAAIACDKKTPVVTPPPSGSVDTTFGNGGSVVTTVSANDDAFNGVAVQSDNKIVAVGRSQQTTQDFVVVRYNADGTLDNSFGTGGIAFADFNADDEAHDVAIQSDGKIVVVGSAVNGLTTDFAIARFNANGTLDTTFNSTGLTMVDFAGDNDVATGVAILPSGAIAVTGIGKAATNDLSIILLTPAGVLDTNFSGDGKHQFDFAGDDDIAYDVGVLANGNIVIAGSCKTGNGGRNFGLACIDATGAPVTGFGTNARANVDFNGGDDIAYAIWVTSTHIILAGKARVGGRNIVGLARFDQAGAIDATFGTNGIVSTDFDANYSLQTAEGVAVQSDGKIVIAGTVKVNLSSDEDIAIARYNADGSLDTSFNTTGLQVTAINGTNPDRGHAVAPHQGKFVVAGETQTSGVGANYEVVLIRYNP